MLSRLLGLVLLLGACAAAALPAAAQSPENWQQRVEYDMDITLHADDHRYTGAQTIEYTNNSPDTLSTVYFHLYFNAFKPESMMAERNRHVPDPDGRIVPRIFNLSEQEQGWHRIRKLDQDGEILEFQVLDTVMRVRLRDPIPPGASTTFDMTWEAQIPLQTRRSGRDSRGGGIDFSMAQWYPKMAEYDERGWHADPYVMREFYAPYGTFDVKLTLPAEYTVGATGLLQNASEVGRGYDQPGTVQWTPADGIPDADSLTWHFVAENVHDFAWAADPDYVHDKVEADGVTHHILYKPDVEEAWAPLMDDMPRLTRFFVEQYGPYPYPQMTVAQGGDGGMEYPMFTLVSGYDNPEFVNKDSRLSILGTTVHEFAHMWYYAALGTNESDYAWMDEGFTSYATAEGMAFLTGGQASHSPLSIVRLQKLGLFEKFDTPADWFQTNAAYGTAAYPGGELLVAMLGYVIGDDARDRWLHRYLRERKYQHPDPYDLELFAEQESGMKLDWYFWQTANSTRILDDALEIESQRRTGEGVEVTLELERKGEAVMPHDIALTLEDGSTQMVHVPLLITQGHKPVGDDWIVTLPWPWVYPEQTVTVTVPSRVTDAVLDPEGRTPDVNRLNNHASLPTQTRFLHPPSSRWSHYGVGLRPLAGYATEFGFGAGLQARGTYFMGEHETRAMVTLWPQVLYDDFNAPDLTRGDGTTSQQTGEDPGSWFGGLDYELSYERPMRGLDPLASLRLTARKHLGFLENRATLQIPMAPLLANHSERLRLTLQQQYNPSDRVFRYGQNLFGATLTPAAALPDANVLAGLNPFTRSHIVSAVAEYQVTSNEGWIRLKGEVGGTVDRIGGTANRAVLDAVRTADFGGITGRAAFRLGLGTSQLVPYKQFQLGGRSIETQWRNDLSRSTASLVDAPDADAHLVTYGPSGPVGYLRSEAPNSVGLFGSNVLSGRLSLHHRPFASVNALSPLGVEVFTGIGDVWGENAFSRRLSADNLKYDAGLGLSYDIASIPHLSRWTGQSDVLQDLNVVARFPLYVSDPEFIDASADEFDFRWLIGIEIR